MDTKNSDAKPKARDKRTPWLCAGLEPKIAEILDDPIVHLIMQSDGLTRDDVRRVVDVARRVWGHRLPLSPRA